MRIDQLEELKQNEILRKRFAKFMTHFCFRDSKIENFHDRFSQDEMKTIMKSAVDNSDMFLDILLHTEKGEK